MRHFFILVLIGMPTWAFANSPFAGAPSSLQQKVVNIAGQPTSIISLGAYYHKMNIKQGQAEPAGLELFFFIEKDPANASDSICEQVYKKVVTDESHSTGQVGTFPYLEIVIAEGAVPVTADNGWAIYSEKDVNCWESYDLGTIFY